MKYLIRCTRLQLLVLLVGLISLTGALPAKTYGSANLLATRGLPILQPQRNSFKSSPAYIQTDVESFRFTAPDGLDHDNFGGATAVSGNTLAIGAPDSDGFGNGPGEVYIYDRSGDTWVEQARLTASDATWSDYFGGSVAIDGDTMIVGAVHSNGLRGAAYVFVRSESGWVEQARLTAPDGEPYDFFGSGVAIDRDRAVVGAWYDDEPASNEGSAYVFRRTPNGWVFEAKLTASDGGWDDNFGLRVVINGNTVVVSAYVADVGERVDQGKVYIFTRRGGRWQEEAILVASDGEAQQTFGSDIALSGKTVIVGASGSNNMSGAVYIFERLGRGWEEHVKLAASDARYQAAFGWSVAFDGDRLAIGAPNDQNGIYLYAGSVYLFCREGGQWLEKRKLVASDPARDDYLAGSLAMSETLLMAGAPGKDIDGNEDEGAAYLFAIPTRALNRY